MPHHIQGNLDVHQTCPSRPAPGHERGNNLETYLPEGWPAPTVISHPGKRLEEDGEKTEPVSVTLRPQTNTSLNYTSQSSSDSTSVARVGKRKDAADVTPRAWRMRMSSTRRGCRSRSACAPTSRACRDPNAPSDCAPSGRGWGESPGGGEGAEAARGK